MSCQTDDFGRVGTHVGWRTRAARDSKKKGLTGVALCGWFAAAKHLPKCT